MRASQRRAFSIAHDPMLVRDSIKHWLLPAALERVRRQLAGSDDGDRQMVAIPAAVLTDGLPAVEAACVRWRKASSPLT
jgi:hypothetical protein